jgi:hypothetical protein
MLNVVFLFGLLMLSGFTFRALWRVLITPVNKHFVVKNTATGPLQIAWLLLQMYIVLGWAAFCVSLVHNFIAKPGVVHSWIYYVLAFFGCGAPLNDRSPESTNTIALFSLGAFLVFSFAPYFSRPWYWFLQFVNTLP